jgi:adenylate cyclase
LNITLDSDAIIRRVPKVVPVIDRNNKTQREKAFAAEIADRYRTRWMKTGNQVPKATPAAWQTWLFPPQSDLALRFPTRRESFAAYSFADIWHCAQESQAEFFKQNFAGKVVLFGTVLNTEDRKITSGRLISEHLQSNAGPNCTQSDTPSLSTISDLTQTIPGVYIQATVIDNLLNGSELRMARGEFGFVTTLLISILGALAISLFSLPAALAVCAALFGLVIAAFMAGFENSFVLPFLAPLLALGLTVMVVYPYRMFVSEKSGRSLKKVFANYVSPNLAKEILANPDAVVPGGTRRVATFLFTDLENFTSLVETNNAEETLEELNHYMGGMIRIALDHGGTIDKIIGDALVCMFGAPVEQPDHAERATRCGLALDIYAQEFRKRPQAMKLGFMRTRIGINTGEAIIGNNGGDIFFDYTGLGDTVNTAARLEGINKYLDTRICISGSTHDQCPSILTREVGDVILKGKKDLVQTLEPLAENHRGAEWLSVYGQSFAALAAGNIALAKELFEKVIAIRGADPISSFHLQRLKDGATDTTIVFESK